ncbi:hypothetical protein M4L39_13690 [Staphylococcus equorum]|uniref:hypothetical protein n=1 Tax=Staphylococcus equorum TaxID=246432 RepID=UPI0024077FEF|nr:hypothetical protein [Staphylococcus equorum]MDG0844466.1 hypothetical protein [Staphylococcus equorum]
MKTSNTEIDYLLSRNDFISPFNNSTDIKGFIKDIKTYLMMNFADPKGESLDYIKDIIKNNGIDNPDTFLKKFIFK